MKKQITLTIFTLFAFVVVQAQRTDLLQSYNKQQSDNPKSLEAKFKADKTQGIIPLTVLFTDQSTGNPTSWKWYFGDGDSSTLQNPEHTYTAAGKYDVKLRISDGSMAYVLEKKEYIQVGYNVSNCDTMHYPLPEPLTYYAIAGGKGYVSGNNTYGDKAMCDFFDNMNPNLVVSGVLMDFAKAKKGSSPDVKIPVCLWATNSTTGAPGNLIASDTVMLSKLVADVAGSKVTSIEFDQHIPMSASFFMGVYLPTVQGDTLCFWSTAQGKVPVNTGWVLTSDQGWKSAQSLWSQGTSTFLISNAIYPKVCTVNGISDKPEMLSFYIYPNPATDILTIVNQNPERASYSITISDMTGNILIKDHTLNELATPVSISYLKPGMYLLKIHDGKHSFISKFIKR